MKKNIIFLFSAIVLSSCGVGTYSLSSGKSDTAGISFTASDKEPIVVVVDGAEFNVMTVRTKVYKSGRNIKSTSQNTINIEPGQHDVKVLISGNEVYNKKLFISATEHRIVEL